MPVARKKAGAGLHRGHGLPAKSANRKGDLYIRGANPESVAILKDSAAARRRTLNDELHARVMFVQRVRTVMDRYDPDDKESGIGPEAEAVMGVREALSEFGLGPLTV